MRTILTIFILGIALSGWANAAIATEVSAATDSPPPVFVPMSDAAAQGIGCLALATPVMAAAYSFGPTEIMMLVTGAVIVPSSNAQLFITLGGILGAAICGVGASLTPSVIWAVERMNWTDPASNTNATLQSGQGGLMKVAADSAPIAPTVPTAPPAIAQTSPVSPAASTAPPEMTEEVIEGAGCLAGVLGLSAITLASAPIEIVGLAAGGVAVSSNTPILLLAIAGTIVPAGCTLGAAASLPLLALSKSLGLDSVGQSLAAFFGWGQSTSTMPIAYPKYRHAEDTLAVPVSSLVQSHDRTNKSSGT
jgi:hypothetical protein